jgi:hypothetical protein
MEDDQKAAFLSEYSTTTSGQVVGAHVLLGFNKWSALCGRESTIRSGTEARSFYIYVQRVKVLVLFSRIARDGRSFYGIGVSYLFDSPVSSSVFNLQKLALVDRQRRNYGSNSVKRRTNRWAVRAEVYETLGHRLAIE